MSISKKTRKMLWSRAAGRCAFPECRYRELVMDASPTDDEAIVGEECHIVAKSPTGPRGESPLTSKQRDHYDNLILLCRVHHKLVDDQEKTQLLKAPSRGVSDGATLAKFRHKRVSTNGHKRIDMI